MPPEFTLLKIEGTAAAIKLEDLPPDWTTRLDVTRDMGAQWLRKKQGVLLHVPSAIVPETVNFLFNPMHADAARFGEHVPNFAGDSVETEIRAGAHAQDNDTAVEVGGLRLALLHENAIKGDAQSRPAQCCPSRTKLAQT